MHVFSLTIFDKKKEKILDQISQLDFHGFIFNSFLNSEIAYLVVRL